MHCPACQTDNPTDPARCGSCGQPLAPAAPSPRPRARKRNLIDDTESPFGPCTNENNRPALHAYRLSVLALVPVLGALLGPASVVLAARALRSAGQGFTAHGPAYAALVLGSAVTLTNWAGLTLIVLALR